MQIYLTVHPRRNFFWKGTSRWRHLLGASLHENLRRTFGASENSLWTKLYHRTGRRKRRCSESLSRWANCRSKRTISAGRCRFISLPYTTHTRTHTPHTHARMHIHTHANTHACTQHTHAHLHIRTHAHARTPNLPHTTHTHTRKHTYARKHTPHAHAYTSVLHRAGPPASCWQLSARTCNFVTSRPYWPATLCLVGMSTTMSIWTRVVTCHRLDGSNVFLVDAQNLPSTNLSGSLKGAIFPRPVVRPTPGYRLYIQSICVSMACNEQAMLSS